MSVDYEGSPDSDGGRRTLKEDRRCPEGDRLRQAGRAAAQREEPPGLKKDQAGIQSPCQAGRQACRLCGGSELSLGVKTGGSLQRREKEGGMAGIRQKAAVKRLALPGSQPASQ